MIPFPSGVRVWLATGRTDMRRGMNGWPSKSKRSSSAIPMAGTCSSSAAGAAT
jgi:transposase